MGRWIQYELGRRLRKQELERQKDYTDEILDGIDDVFYVLDEEGNLQWWNESASEVARCSEADFEASHALDFFEGDDVDVVADGI